MFAEIHADNSINFKDKTQNEYPNCPQKQDQDFQTITPSFSPVSINHSVTIKTDKPFNSSAKPVTLFPVSEFIFATKRAVIVFHASPILFVCP